MRGVLKALATAAVVAVSSAPACGPGPTAPECHQETRRVSYRVGVALQETTDATCSVEEGVWVCTWTLCA